MSAIKSDGYTHIYLYIYTGVNYIMTGDMVAMERLNRFLHRFMAPAAEKQRGITRRGWSTAKEALWPVLD